MMNILDNHTRNTQPCVATIGFFDGVHTGHRFLIEQVKAEAARRGMRSLLITFDQHPLTTIRPDFRPLLLSTATEKQRMLSDSGVDAIAVLDFTRELSLMSARDFMEQVLLKVYNVRTLLIGHDHHFGHNREEGFADYARYGRELGIDVVQADALTAKGLVPSSTLIRQALQQGDITLANTVLGYPYSLEGTVVSGFQNGRKLGYPTANLSVADDKLIPACGAYFVSIAGLGYGMLNVGTRPTLHNGDERSIEVHVFDFQGELYSHTISVSLLRFIRKERQFDSLDTLSIQLAQDEKMCRALMRHFISNK